MTKTKEPYQHKHQNYNPNDVSIQNQLTMDVVAHLSYQLATPFSYLSIVNVGKLVHGLPRNYVAYD